MQNEQNPDVNTPYPDDSEPETGPSGAGSPRTNVERPGDDETAPVPPDQRPAAPVEEPPGGGKPPVGDVDDSPKRIV